MLWTSILFTFLARVLLPAGCLAEAPPGFFCQREKRKECAWFFLFSRVQLNIRNGLVRAVNVAVRVQVCLLPARNGTACSACSFPPVAAGSTGGFVQLVRSDSVSTSATSLRPSSVFLAARDSSLLLASSSTSVGPQWPSLRVDATASASCFGPVGSQP